MAWMPVAEAAAALGVSERTIWRRIKNDAIPSRSENSRTLVEVEESSAETDTVRQLSHVAAAQLSMRKLDADNVADVLAIVTDYRRTFEIEIAGARRSRRWLVAAVVGLLAGLAAATAHHFVERDRLHNTHQQQIADVRTKQQQRVEQLTGAVARAEGEAAARSESLAQLELLTASQQDDLAALAQSRHDLQCVIDERLAAVQRLVNEDTDDDLAREQQLAVLHTDLAALQTELHRRTQLYLQVQHQQQQVNAAIRRSAARSIGMAEGLRLHVTYQDRRLRDLHRELADAQALLANTPPSDGPGDGLAVRRELLASLVNEPLPQAEPDWLRALLARPDTGPWHVLINGLSRVWLLPAVSGPNDDERPSAGPVEAIPDLASEFASAQ